MFGFGGAKRVQPVHLKDALVAAMRREKRELPHGDYAPNCYVITLHPGDYRRWANLKRRILRQFKSHLEKHIQKEAYYLDAELEIVIQESPQIPAGKFSVSARFEDPQPEPEPELLVIPMLSHEDGVPDLTPNGRFDLGLRSAPSSEATDSEDAEGTAILASEAGESGQMLEIVKTPLATLRVLQGEDAGLRFPIERLPVVVGRIGRGADIALHDSHRYISRQQFEITRHREGFFELTDLRCRADLQVFVNGEQAEPTLPLHSGDHIRLGTARTAVTEMEFTVL